MDSDTIRNRIQDASDDDPTIRGLYHTGEGDENIRYYLVVASKQHEGKEMLKLRYFALHPKTPGKDTWMQNGLTTRTSDEMLEGIIASLKLMTNGDLPEGAFNHKDISESLP